MVRLRFERKSVTLLVGGIVFLLTVAWQGNAQNRDLMTFSGRAIDEVGNPVAGLTITFVSVVDGNGAWFPIHEDQHGSPIDPPTFQSETDAEGHFAITNVIAGPVLLTLSDRDVEPRLLKAQIRGLFFYAGGMWKRGIVFDVEQGDCVENIEVTVQSPHIRGRVQRVNGTPIANERVKFRMRTFSLNGRSSSSSSTHTDAEGYFGYYVNGGVEEPTFYMLSITYQGQTVNANPIVLKPGDPTRDIVFTFDGPAPPLATQLKNFFSASASASIGGSSAVDVWVIRPENWHAYKMIERERWESAQAQAAAEGAYLVAINDEAEQNWLQAVFGGQPSWISNVVGTVQPRMRIRGRILFKDGTPLPNARVRLHFSSYNVESTGNRQSGGDPRTDAAGYFIYYLDEKDDTAFYTFSVEYQGLFAEAEPVRLEPGQRFDGLTLTFDSQPILPEPTQAMETDTAEPPLERESHAVWIVNPANGHAYKKVHCETRDEAIPQTTDAEAHLVAINDAAEQAWLEAVFGQEFYWIGLSDVEKEGQWQWDNGEPVTYENWLPDDFFSESLEVDERDYAVMTFADSKWYAVSAKSVIWAMTQMAILEKAMKNQE